MLSIEQSLWSGKALSRSNLRQMEKPLIATNDVLEPANQEERSLKRHYHFNHTGSPPALGPPRDFLDNRFVYCVISQRARGLSIGVNMNPDKYCNFDCVYCEIDRTRRGRDRIVDIELLAGELERTLALANQNRLREMPAYGQVPAELLKLKEVALSGDGEPTLCPNFAEVVHTVVHLRAKGLFPFFKIVLITNATGLQLSDVQNGLKLFTSTDEVWTKLDAGTQAFMNEVNRSDISLEQVLANILMLGRKRPIVIQSLFPLIRGEQPPPEEIEQYVQRLRELKDGGAKIMLVQVYSAHRPAINADCGHLPLRGLSRIAQRVREATGLKAEVF
ncbi:MAG: radical SAM protein [Verrucomicrobiota bacterium]